MKNKQALLLFLIFVLALGLRLGAITFDSFWLDEGYQSLVDAYGKPLPDFTRVSDKPYLFQLKDPQNADKVLANFKKVDPLCPPLYALTLNAWMKVCGQSDFAIRLLSALFSLAGVFAIFFFADKTFGRKAALFSAMLCAISPFDIYYGQEARMYSLTVLLATISCGSFILLVNGLPAKKTTAFYLGTYILATFALINTHYTNLFIVLFQGVYGFLFSLSQRRYKLLLLLSTAWLAVLFAWLPWFDIFRHAASIRTQSFYVARKASFIWPITALLVKIPLNWVGFLSGKRVAIFAAPIYLTSALLLFTAACAVRGLLKTSDTTSSQQAKLKQSILAVCLWLIMPALFLWLLDVVENHRVIEITRYVIGTSPACYMLAGLGLATYFGQNVKVRILLFAHLVLALINNAWAHIVPQREPWRKMACVVEQTVPNEDMIFVSQYYDIVLIDRYLSRPHKQIGISPAMGDAHIKEVVSHYPRFWLLTGGDGESIVADMPISYQMKKQIDLAHGLHLRLYENSVDKQIPGQNLRP